MNEEQRPREKALRQGLETLSDLELVALLLQSGSKNRSVFDIAHDVLLKTDGLEKLFNLHVNTLMEIKGIREVKALQLLASVELCKRVMRAHVYQIEIKNVQDIISWFQMEYGYLEQEHFVCIYLNGRGRIIKHKVLAIGTFNEANIHPMDVFKEAYLQNSAAIICVHNHPTGDPSPSQADYKITEKIQQIATMMSVQLVDHVIVGKEQYFSFREAKALN